MHFDQNDEGGVGAKRDRETLQQLIKKNTELTLYTKEAETKKRKTFLI